MKALIIIISYSLFFTFCKAQQNKVSAKSENALFETIFYRKDSIELELTKTALIDDTLILRLSIKNHYRDTIFFDKKRIDYQIDAISLMPDLNYRLPITLYEIPPQGKEELNIKFYLDKTINTFTFEIGIIYNFERFMEYTKAKIEIQEVNNKLLKLAWFQKFPKNGMTYITIDSITRNFNKDTVKIDLKKY